MDPRVRALTAAATSARSEYLATQVKAGTTTRSSTPSSPRPTNLIAEADAAAGSGHARTARDCYLRAAAYLGVGYHPLYGTPVDPRLVDAFHLQMATFAKAMALRTSPGRAAVDPLRGHPHPGVVPASPRPPTTSAHCIVVGGGWDSTMVENHLGIGVAALERGYHVLLHDGPGQGKLLIDEGLPLRHDWEHVVTPVVDAALAIDVVDGDRLVYQPWSLGGYMAPRVAAFEHRFAAVIADPGQLAVGGKITAMASMSASTPTPSPACPSSRPTTRAMTRSSRQPRAALEDHPARVLDERGVRHPGVAGRDGQVETDGTMKIVEKIAAIFVATVLTTTVASAQEVKHVAANGLSFAYVEEGSGPPVVLVHGSIA